MIGGRHLRGWRVCLFQKPRVTITLGTFTLHLRLAALFVLLFRDPHLLKGSQRCQYRAADPRTEPTLAGTAGAYNFQPHTL